MEEGSRIDGERKENGWQNDAEGVKIGGWNRGGGTRNV